MFALFSFVFSNDSANSSHYEWELVEPIVPDNDQINSGIEFATALGYTSETLYITAPSFEYDKTNGAAFEFAEEDGLFTYTGAWVGHENTSRLGFAAAATPDSFLQTCDPTLSLSCVVRTSGGETRLREAPGATGWWGFALGASDDMIAIAAPADGAGGAGYVECYRTWDDVCNGSATRQVDGESSMFGGAVAVSGAALLAASFNDTCALLLANALNMTEEPVPLCHPEPRAGGTYFQRVALSPTHALVSFTPVSALPNGSVNLTEPGVQAVYTVPDGALVSRTEGGWAAAGAPLVTNVALADGLLALTAVACASADVVNGTLELRDLRAATLETFAFAADAADAFGGAHLSYAFGLDGNEASRLGHHLSVAAQRVFASDPAAEIAFVLSLACAPHWAGAACDECAAFWAGAACDECPPNFAGAGCDRCADNFVGDTCDKCAEHFTGSSCSECAGHFAGDDCAACEEPFSGADCDTCEGWLFGCSVKLEDFVLVVIFVAVGAALIVAALLLLWKNRKRLSFELRDDETDPLLESSGDLSRMRFSSSSGTFGAVF